MSPPLLRASRLAAVFSTSHVVCLVLLFASAACVSDVRVEDGGGSAGGAGSTSTGVGGSGGEAPGVVGCEQLVLDPEPLVIPDGQAGHLLRIDDTDLGVVYRVSGSGETRSRRLLDAFQDWPPPLTDPLVHGNDPLDTTVPAHSRSDGAFVARRADGWFVGSVDDENVFITSPTSSPTAYPILEPKAGGGVFWSEQGDLAFYATLDAAEPWETFALPTPLYRRSHGVGFDGATLVVQDALLYRWNGAWSVVNGPASVTEFDQILYRPGGFYVRQYLKLHPYDESGALPSVTLKGPATGQHAATAWRGGAAVTVLSGSDDVLVAVTDGVLETATTRADLGAALNGISIVASPDGDHLYVAFLHVGEEPSDQGLVVRRFDCLSAEP